MSPFVNPWSELLRALWLSSFVSRRRRWFTVFVPVALVYLMTGNYGPVVFIDAAAAFHPAWHLVHHGHLWVDDGALRIWQDKGRYFSNLPQEG